MRDTACEIQRARYNVREIHREERHRDTQDLSNALRVLGSRSNPQRSVCWLSRLRVPLLMLECRWHHNRGNIREPQDHPVSGENLNQVFGRDGVRATASCSVPLSPLTLSPWASHCVCVCHRVARCVCVAVCVTLSFSVFSDSFSLTACVSLCAVTRCHSHCLLPEFIHSTVCQVPFTVLCVRTLSDRSHIPPSKQLTATALKAALCCPQEPSLRI